MKEEGGKEGGLKVDILMMHLLLQIFPDLLVHFWTVLEISTLILTS